MSPAPGIGQTVIMLRILIAALLLPLAGPAVAQTVEFGVAYPPSPSAGPRVEVVFNGVPAERGTVGLRLAAGGELELGLRLREAGSLATVGNLITTLAAHGSTGGRYTVAFTARGVLGPAALRLRASAFDGRRSLAPLAEGEFSELPLLGAGGAVLGLEVGVSYRLSRALIVDLAPALLLRGGRLGAGFGGEARLVRFDGRNDLSLLLHLFAEPGSERLTAAVGAGYTFNRRRAPSWTASGWLGWGPDGLAPGARLSGSQRLENGNLNLLLAAEPYRLDRWPYRLDVTYERGLGNGELVVGLLAGLEPDSGWRAGGRAAYRLPFVP